MMSEVLLLLQIVLLLIQVYCLVKSIKIGESPLEYGYGFAVYGCVPNIILSIIGASL